MSAAFIVRPATARGRPRTERLKLLGGLVVLFTTVLVLLALRRQAAPPPAGVDTDYFQRVVAGGDAPNAPLVAKDPAQAGKAAIVVMQSTVDADRHEMRVPAVLDTWGQLSKMRRNGFDLVFLSCYAPTTWRDEGLVRLCPPDNLGKSKTKRLIWGLGQLARRMPKYEYIFKVDDITFVFPDNLRAYLDKLKSQNDPLVEPIVAGNILGLAPRGPSFPSGGAGIIMSHEFVKRCAENPPLSHPHNEDLAIAECSQNFGHMIPAVSEESQELLSVFGPVRTMQNDADEWYKKYKANAITLGVSPKVNAGVPSRIISFHYVEYQMAYYLDEMLSSSYWKWDASKALDKFPKHGIGGYERRITKKEEAAQLLELIRPLYSRY